MNKRLLIGPAIFLLVWFFFSYLNLVNALFLPSPVIVFKSLLISFSTGNILPDIIMTCYRMLTGFCISAFIGIILGLLMGYSTNIYDIFEFLVDFFRSIPGLALFPLFMLVLGIGDKARIGVVVFACSLVVLINTMYGVLNAKKIRIRAAKIMGADKITLFRKVIFWEALPSISSGLRISLSMALLITIVTEMFIGTKYGLGQRIFNSHLVYRIPDMYSSIILTGFLGYGLNKVYMYFERKIVHWTGK